MKCAYLFPVVLLAACGADKDYEPAFNYGTAKDATPVKTVSADSILRKSLLQPATVAAVPAGNAASKGPVNPAHGAPGHRCELPVGAPLNTAAPAQQTTVNTPTQVTAVPQAAPAGVPTGKGLNPAHGQPGHRCDIAVGAPLNSKPAAPVATPAAKAATAQKTAPGMNPPHGEPGHRCDIAVGAPLNSKPVATPSSPASAASAKPVPTNVGDSSAH